MKIAITVNCGQPMEFMVRTNGIMQNCKFLYDILELMGHEPYFLYFSDGKTEEYVLARKNYRAHNFSDLISSNIEAPLILEIGMTINNDQRDILKSKKSSKLVLVRLGNTYYIDLETLIFKPNSEGIVYCQGADRVWLSPHYVQYMQYNEAINQCPGRIAPYVWEADFTSDAFSEGTEIKGGRDIYVMEPNINITKNSLIPLCIVAELFKKNPNAYRRATILNSEHFKDMPYFLENLIRNLPGTSSNHDKVYFTGRYNFDDVFKRPDVLLCFHHENGLNYLQNEALYKGVPLVHNSEYYKGVGHFYNEYEVQGGVEATEAALAEGFNLDIRKKNRDFLYAFSIHNPKVQQGYAELIADVMKDT